MVNMKDMPRAVDANYAVWSADSVITLTNVPWDNNYRDIVKYADQKALNAYIDKRQTTNVKIERASYARADRPVALGIPMSTAYKYNYVRVYNPPQNPTGNAGMYYYYFVTGVEYVNAGTTLFAVQLDVWQTFGHKAKFGNCYIEQGHIGMANRLAFQGYGRDYLGLAEGLDTGADLRIIHETATTIIDPVNCFYMVIMNTDPESDPGDKDDPSLRVAPGGPVLNTPSGSTYYFFKTVGDFQKFLAAYASYPWILQGIVSITAVPNLDQWGYKFAKLKFAKGTFDVYKLNTSQPGRGKYVDLFNTWRNSSTISGRIPERYRKLRKLFTYPYMAIEMTTNNGAPIVLKPEMWQMPHASIGIKANIVSPGSRVVMYPRKYNGDPNAVEVTRENSDGSIEYFQDGGDYLQMSTFVANFPTFSTVANGGTLAIANMAHSLAQQYKAADWSQNKALQGADTSYDQASAALDNSNYQSYLGRYTATAQTGIANDRQTAGVMFNAAMGIGQGAIGGGASGGAPGAIGGAAAGAVGAVGSAGNAALDIQSRNRSLGVNNAASQAAQSSNASTSAFMRDTNYALSQYAARGDYQQTVAAINAKVADTAMTPPFTAGQAGGDMFNFVFGGIKLFTRWKLVPQAQLRAIGEYWLRYGYAVRQFGRIPDSLMVMTKFTYWKLSETYLISTEIPEGIKQAIRGIFEKGVTVYKNADDIGQIDMADNDALEGIEL